MLFGAHGALGKGCRVKAGRLEFRSSQAKAHGHRASDIEYSGKGLGV